MPDKILILPITIPLLGALAVLATPKAWRGVKEAITLVATLVTLVITLSLFGKSLSYSIPWAGFGISFSLRLYHFSSFIIAAVSSFGFLIAIYSSSFLFKKDYSKQFYSYLLISFSVPRHTASGQA